MFVELDELCVGENKEWAWHEKARWIKFEEEVEETAQRWGKPHVSSLSFHSLLELRRRIESGLMLAYILTCNMAFNVSENHHFKFIFKA